MGSVQFESTKFWHVDFPARWAILRFSIDLEFCKLQVRRMTEKLADRITGYLTGLGNDESLESRDARDSFKNGGADQASWYAEIFQPSATSSDVARDPFSIRPESVQYYSSSCSIAPLDIFSDSSQSDGLFGCREI